MNYIYSFLLVLTFSLVCIAPAAPGQHDSDDWRSHSRKVFDNGNIDACETTDTAQFTIERPLRVDRIEVWYRWRAREESVAYTLSRDGHTIRSGVMVRGDCDPYQEKWCVAAEGVDLRLRAGTYIVRTERPRICQNSGTDGNGVVRVFGAPR